MKYCAYCGKELMDEAVICSGCGCPTRLFYQINSEKQQAQTQQQTQPQQAKPEVAVTTNTYSILSLVFAFIFPILGIVFGKVGLNDIKKNGNQKGEDIAKAGIILSIILIVLQVLAIVLVVVFFAAIIGSVDVPPETTNPNGMGL